MKKNLLKNAFMACISVALVATMFVACDKDDDNKQDPADKTTLTALVTECETLAKDATTDDYPQAAITSFKTVIAAAKTALQDESVSQTAVDNLVVQLTQAKGTFLAAAYDAIPAAALLIGLSFDEGTNTTTSLTATGKNLTATLAKAPAELFGADKPMPTFVDGQKGKAIHFQEGSHLEIATYSRPDFEGSQFSVAVWVKPDVSKAPNYIISYNDWHSWKFQIQDNNKPFFTVSTTVGVTDADNESDGSAPNGQWTHLAGVVNLTTGIMDFYVNGVLTKHWTTETKSNLSGTITPNEGTWPICIGVHASYAAAIADWDGWTAENWSNYFEGAMDELKVYNIALTEGQVAKLYNDEK